VDEVLPGELVAESMTLRCWRIDDAPKLAELVAANVDHLRPWMPWIATEPLPLTDRRELIAGWHAERSRGGDAVYGVFVDGLPVGGCGLHRGIGLAPRLLLQTLSTRVPWG
jgi:ribosomal-protein-serine acetyltransferase